MRRKRRPKEYQTVKLRKDWLEHQHGERVQVVKWLAESLIQRGVASAC